MDIKVYQPEEKIEVNGQRLYIECLGSGAGLNTILKNTSFILYVPESRARVLLDCGFTVTPTLAAQGRLKDITDILITHPHSDHMGGVETFGFMAHFAFKSDVSYRKPRLHLATETFKENLWNNCLRGTMEKIQDANNAPLDAKLDTYFDVRIGEIVKIDGMPAMRYRPTPHVQGMEAYGVTLGNGAHFSGDTVELPSNEHGLVFQDAQFWRSKSQVHISLEELEKELTASTKRKTFLTHLGGGYDKVDPIAKGFAGYMMPGQVIETTA